MGTCESPFFMTEQFAFNKVGRECGTIHFHQGTPFAQAQIVNGPGHQFLAGAGLTQNQNVVSLGAICSTL
jgi:hypothetical protein